MLPNNGVNFQGFIRRELLPAIRKRYNVSRNPRYNAVVGFSLGGLAATYTAFTQPDLFGNVISQGGSLWWGPQYFSAKDFVEGQYLNTESLGLIQEIAETPTKAIRFYVDVGSWENASGLIPNRTLHSVLKSKDYDVQYNEFLGGHQTLCC